MKHSITTHANAETLSNETKIKAIVQDRWGVQIVERDHYDPIDWQVYRSQVLVAAIELKSYNITAFQYSDAILNLRKYIALRDWCRTYGLPALYMVNFLDEVRYIDVRNVDISFPVLGGQKKQVRSTDWEPIYKIPVSSMKLLAKKGK
jgi:hypothetical protein